MVNVELSPEYGYVLLVLVGFVILQYVVLTTLVVRQRMSTGIAAPILYPRDSDIKELKLTKKQVAKYMCAQRAHQNNMEFLHLYIPLLLVAGLFNARSASIAGLLTLLGRTIGMVGYTVGRKTRRYGSFYMIPMMYTLYLVVNFSVYLVTSS